MTGKGLGEWKRARSGGARTEPSLLPQLRFCSIPDAKQEALAGAIIQTRSLPRELTGMLIPAGMPPPEEQDLALGLWDHPDRCIPGLEGSPRNGVIHGAHTGTPGSSAPVPPRLPGCEAGPDPCSRSPGARGRSPCRKLDSMGCSGARPVPAGLQLRSIN